MNKIIPFNKDITFKENIGEITSIALDDTLKLVDPYNIKGELIVRGCNKVSDFEENFSYPLPVDIAIDSKYDTSKCSISIDDFYYEIINENVLKVKIDLLLDDLFYLDEPILKDDVITVDSDRELNLDFELEKAKNELDIDFNLETKKDITKNIKKDNTNKIEDLFKETSNDIEYSIYRVYTMMENETLNDVIEKYKITKEELEIYNDLTNLQVGVKLIIPSLDE